MKRLDILTRLRTEIEDLYDNPDTELDGAGVEVINFELMEDGSLRVYVKVSFLGAWTILHGRINDARDYGIDLTLEEREFLTETVSQAPARVAPPTRVAQYVKHLVSQLEHLVDDKGSFLYLSSALLSNRNLTDLMHSEQFYPEAGVDSIVAYVERVLGDLTCSADSEECSQRWLWIVSLLSNPRLMSIIQHQQYLDDEVGKE